MWNVPMVSVLKASSSVWCYWEEVEFYQVQPLTPLPHWYPVWWKIACQKSGKEAKVQVMSPCFTSLHNLSSSPD